MALCITVRDKGVAFKGSYLELSLETLNRHIFTGRDLILSQRPLIIVDGS